MNQNIDFKNIIHLPIDDGFPIQSTPLTEQDDRIIRAFIKKSKTNQRRRQLYAHRKIAESINKSAKFA